MGKYIHGLHRDDREAAGFGHVTTPLSDSCMETKYGRFKSFSAERHQLAQRCEMGFWREVKTPLRNSAQAAAFDGFKDLPARLGDVVEVGCGPYTKLRLMLETRPELEIRRVTLEDPLVITYVREASQVSFPNETNFQLCPSTWKNFPTKGRPCIETTLDPRPAEKPYPAESFDTAVMLNVLEHVFDAVAVLNNLCSSLKPGGLLVFQEEFFEHPERHIDKCHPIKVTLPFYREFVDDNFDVLFEHVEEASGRLKSGRISVIARKKP